MRVRWVKVWVDAMATLTERFRDEEGRVDFEALGREEYAFRHALVTGDFSRSERARDLYDATINEITSRSEAGRKGAEARWSRNTAAATTREGVDVVPDRESGSFARTTGCNHSQVAPTSNAGDESSDTGNGAALKSATACNSLTADGDIREESQNVTDSSNAGTLESGTSANHYGPRQAEAREIHTGAGEVHPESASAKPSPALPVPAKMPAKKAHGEFGNVKLTSDEYSKLLTRVDNAQDLIEELDQYIESQGKGKKYKSHYATLLNWSRRKATEAKHPSMYKNINDINRENCEQIERDLRAMFHPEEVI